MNDPHVEALRYKLIPPENEDYNDAPALEHETEDFTVLLDADVATIKLKVHCASIEEARSAVQPFMDGWSISAGLRVGYGPISFRFIDGDLIDRNPSPGPIFLHVHNALHAHTAMEVALHVTRSAYPTPTSNFAVSDLVRTMYSRYERYWEGATHLTDLGYYCFTALCRSTGLRKGATAAAADKYSISSSVLNKLATLTSTKGGDVARKAGAADDPLTPEEEAWILEAVTKLIRRAGEAAAHPESTHSQITMADLPQLVDRRY